MLAERINVECTLLAGKTPRWEGDCIHCSFMDIPPGITGICAKCHQPVCAGHISHHGGKFMSPHGR